MPESSYDCIVIGSGPGGYVAAIRAAQVGMKTAVVEKDVVGGRCLNYACIPAKAVLRSADILSEIREAGEFGLKVGEPEVDFSAISDRRKKVIKTLTGGVSGLFKKNKIDFIEGHGSLTDDGNVKIGGNFDGNEIQAGKVILATSSRSCRAGSRSSARARRASRSRARTRGSAPRSCSSRGSSA
jgi:dihydrolipoamide dehydrogenase